jgi:excisionase family DNA binding protein
MVTIPEAAKILGVTEDTVRRRLRRGELQGERVERPQGYTWIVHLDQDQVDPDYSECDNQEDTHHSSELEDFLRDQIKIKDEQIGMLLQELRELRQLALPAPGDTKKRSWWRRRLR